MYEWEDEKSISCETEGCEAWNGCIQDSPQHVIHPYSSLHSYCVYILSYAHVIYLSQLSLSNSLLLLSKLRRVRISPNLHGIFIQIFRCGRPLRSGMPDQLLQITLDYLPTLS